MPDEESQSWMTESGQNILQDEESSWMTESTGQNILQELKDLNSFNGRMKIVIMAMLVLMVVTFVMLILFINNG